MFKVQKLFNPANAYPFFSEERRLLTMGEIAIFYVFASMGLVVALCEIARYYFFC